VEPGVDAMYDDDGGMLVECEKDENIAAHNTRTWEQQSRDKGKIKQQKMREEDAVAKY